MKPNKEKHVYSCTSPSGYSLVTISDSSSNDGASEAESAPESASSTESEESAAAALVCMATQAEQAGSRKRGSTSNTKPQVKRTRCVRPEPTTPEEVTRLPSPPPERACQQQPSQHAFYTPLAPPPQSNQPHHSQPRFQQNAQQQGFHPNDRFQHQTIVHRPINLTEQNTKNINHLLTILYKDSLDRNEQLAIIVQNMNYVLRDNKTLIDESARIQATQTMVQQNMASFMSYILHNLPNSNDNNPQ
jgi:hypothetical protein